MKKKIVIVGAGALGSHVVQLIRTLDVQVQVIDHDRVEQKNLLSQFHTKQSVGKSKVVALQQSMAFLFGTKIDAIPHKLTRDNADQLLLGASLVVDCLDNEEARRIVQDTTRKHGIACLHGALAAEGQFGRVVWTHLFTIDGESPGVVTCEDGEHLAFIAITASYIAYSVQQFVRRGKRFNFNIFPGGSTSF